MSGLRERAIEAHREQEQRMNGYESERRRKSRAKLRRKGARLLRRKFGVECTPDSLIDGTGRCVYVDVDDLRLFVVFADKIMQTDVTVNYGGHNVRDLADLGRVIERDRRSKRAAA